MSFFTFPLNIPIGSIQAKVCVLQDEAPFKLSSSCLITGGVKNSKENKLKLLTFSGEASNIQINH
ncbi:hypothetical protein LC2W_0067 [Lacticaseibacillus paracasei]|jgi:hypothetical protein|nr:hypothetical protein LC2W_0067 [Lacticaseibacillus paracasei]KTE98793.1 hypothetical protein AC564_1424 [Lacticaseibacillus paracasei]